VTKGLLLSQKGAILIFVLWVIAFLSMIGGYFTLETTLRRNLGFGAWNMLKSRLMVESVLTVVTPYVKEFSDNDNEVNNLEKNSGLILPDGSEYKIKIGGEELRFSIEDERGKVDINKASEEMLSEVLKGLLGEAKGAIISDSILDWRDNDDDKRTHGAESEYYRSLDVPYEASNSKFVLLEQLLLVHGVNPILFWGPLDWRSTDSKDEEPEWSGGLQDIFTIYNGSDKIIKEASPKPLIDILRKEYFKEAKGLGILRFKTCAYQACYQIFFEKQTGSKLGFKLIHWEQVPRFN